MDFLHDVPAATSSSAGPAPDALHCIGYQIDQDGHRFLQALAREYHGEYRRVQRLR